MQARSLAAALLAALLSAASGGAAAKTLVYCSEANPNSFQPALHTDGATFDASGRTIYDRLVEFKPGTTEVGPGLAESWQIADDGKTYTFHLRHGVQFQTNFGFKPSRELNADDVLFSFQRMADKAHPYHAVGATYDYFVSMDLPRLLERVEAPDPYTVRFVLREPNAPFLADLAMDFASIASAEYADQLARQGRKQDFDLKPIGSGPFLLQSYQPDSVIRFRAFDHYWRGRAALDQLVFAITPNASVRWAKLRANECQVMAYPNPADLAAMRSTPNIKLLSQPGLNIGYLAFNTEKKPFNDPRVRLALNLAIDRKAIIDAVYQGVGTVAVNPIPPTIWSYDSSQQPIAYDPAQARKLLAESGHPDGFDTNLWAMTASRPYLPDARRVAVMIQQDWAKVGVRATIVSYEWGEYLKRIGKGEHQTALLGWTGDNGDPDNFLATLLGCSGVHTPQNAAEWCWAPYQKLVDQAVRTQDHGQRVELYQQAQRVFRQQLPWAPLAHSLSVTPIRSNVHGFVVWPTGLHVFYGVSLD